MTEPLIHPTALISSVAELAPDVQIGPYSIIEAGTVLKEGVMIGPYVLIQKGTTLEARVRVSANAVIGGLPQVYHFDSNMASGVIIGEGTVIGEGVTIHRGTIPEGLTRIGPGCFIMTYAHVGHDAILGQEVTLTNNVMIGGFAQLGDFANVGGGAAIHQKVRIGAETMLSAMSFSTMDVPPYVLVANRNSVYGLNLIGIKRRGATQAVIGDLKQCFQRVYGERGNLQKTAAEALAAGLPETLEGRRFLEFFLTGGKRGFVRPEIRGGG